MSTLHLRMRPDLILKPQGKNDGRHWVVQDPVGLRYFRLRNEECAILQMLDGRTSLEEIVARFEEVFAPLTLSGRQLHAFLFRLHESGLVVADALGQGRVLGQRAATARRSALLGALANPLAIRLPGISAGTLVDWLYPRLAWAFSPLFLTLSATLVAAALGLVLLQFGAFQARLPDFSEFFSAQSAALFVVALVAVKALHELGHALTCRHFGGRCREVGVLLLVGTPTLYCDVSDSWQLPGKWQRIAIASAGMAVELILAALCTLLWWFSEPGLLNSLCLRLMFLTSVSTLLFNLNPLLRCDGYYILSDLIEVPNLWQESRGLLRAALGRWLLGLNIPDDPTLPRKLRLPLLAYAVASIAYSLLLIAAILWFCLQVAEPLGLAPLALLLATVVLTGMAVVPLQNLSRAMFRPQGRRKFRRGRAALTLLISLAAAGLVLFVPLPHRISAPAWLEPRDAQSVYVSVPGRLDNAIAPGASVEAGAVIATLSSLEIEMNLAQVAAEVRQAELRLKNLRLLQADDPAAAPLIPAAEKSLDDARLRLAQWQADDARLRLTSPAAGTVLPPPAMTPAAAGGGSLPAWQVTPLDPQNQGCYLEAGTLVCLVGDPGRLEAMLVIEQADRPFVFPGQRVTVQLATSPPAIVTGVIAELAQANADDLAPALARALDLPLRYDPQQGSHAMPICYQARVTLDPHAAQLTIGLTGRARIAAGWQPLGNRLWRYLLRTFRLS